MPPKASTTLLHRRLDLGEVEHVHLDPQGPPTHRPDLRLEVRGVGRRPASPSATSAPASASDERDVRTEAARRAGDERDASTDREVRVLAHRVLLTRVQWIAGGGIEAQAHLESVAGPVRSRPPLA